jgi:hypothetical protein
MKNNQFTSDYLQQVRKQLPYGGQKQIVQRLSNSGFKISQRDVYMVLNGCGLMCPKPSPALIIKVAQEIINEVSGLPTV